MLKYVMYENIIHLFSFKSINSNIVYVSSQGQALIQNWKSVICSNFSILNIKFYSRHVLNFLYLLEYTCVRIFLLRCYIKYTKAKIFSAVLQFEELLILLRVRIYSQITFTQFNIKSWKAVNNWPFNFGWKLALFRGKKLVEYNT